MSDKELELQLMTRAQLKAEALKLFLAIKEHHDQHAEDRCIFDDTKLYAAAGLGPADHRVGDKFAMAKNCLRFIDVRCEGGHWPTYVELEQEISRLNAVIAWLSPRP